MVKISGTEEEVKLIVAMIHEADNACTYKTANMPENQFGVEKCTSNEKLYFMVEYEFINKT